MEKERLKAINGLKGICCIPILFIHYNAVAGCWDLMPESLPFYRVFGALYKNGASCILLDIRLFDCTKLF